MPIFDRYFATRQKLQVSLVGFGFLAGALVSFPLTAMGKIVAEAPPATIGNYLWNAVAFGVLGALIGPVVTWQALRNAPLWRTIIEPAVGGAFGAILAAVLSSGVALLLFTPLGMALAAARLSYAYNDKRRIAPSGRGPALADSAEKRSPEP